MLKRIEKQINEFANTIKEAKGCDELIVYMRSSFVASVKLLMFASAVFSLYMRVMLILFIGAASLLLASLIGAISVSIPFLLAMTLMLFAMILMYILKCRNLLTVSIQNTKEKMTES